MHFHSQKLCSYPDLGICTLTQSVVLKLGSNYMKQNLISLNLVGQLKNCDLLGHVWVKCRPQKHEGLNLIHQYLH